MAKRKHLGEFEQVVLLVTWRLGEGAYAPAIRDEILERTGRRRSISAIYVTLTRLEKQGYVDSEFSDPEPVRGGKSKRIFELTEKGLDSLRETRETMERLWNGLEAEQP